MYVCMYVWVFCGGIFDVLHAALQYAYEEVFGHTYIHTYSTYIHLQMHILHILFTTNVFD